jgi:hypothetical protein
VEKHVNYFKIGVNLFDMAEYIITRTAIENFVLRDDVKYNVTANLLDSLGYF